MQVKPEDVNLRRLTIAGSRCSSYPIAKKLRELDNQGKVTVMKANGMGKSEARIILMDEVK